MSSLKENIKKNKMLYIILISVVLVVIFISILLISVFSKKKEVKVNDGDYRVVVHIDFIENLIFSKYDVKFTIGDKNFNLSHGESKDLGVYLNQGTYMLSFEKEDDSSIKYEEEIEVNGNMELSYKISCYYNRLSVENTYFNDNSNDEGNADKIKINFDKYQYIDKNYNEVIEELKSLGFTNVIENPSYDLTLYGILNYTFNEQVTSVSINGSTDYRSDNLFNKDAKVVVSYHARDIDDPSKIKPPYDSESAKNVNYEIVVEAFKSAGFLDVTANGTSGDGEDKTVNLIKIGSVPVDINSTYSSQEKVYIYYYDETVKPKEDERISTTKLDLYYARKAFEEYGEKQYKYGFKCHWWVGLLDEKENSDGTYTFKVEVTITNDFGAEYDVVASGVVGGSNANPNVLSFNIED